MNKKLKKLKLLKNLVSISRNKIDDNSIQGFILGYSKKLILLQYVYDFNVDGIMVLRTKDVTSISSNGTDIFQTKILEDEGLLLNVDFDKYYDVQGWQSVFNEFYDVYRFVTIEDEVHVNPLFVLGEVNKIGKNKVSVLEFSGTAKWYKNLTKLKYKHITLFRVGDNYSKMYTKYYDRNPKMCKEV